LSSVLATGKTWRAGTKGLWLLLLAAQYSEVQPLLSQSLSVYLSVTLVSHAYMVQDIEINFTLYDRRMFLVS